MSNTNMELCKFEGPSKEREEAYRIIKEAIEKAGIDMDEEPSVPKSPSWYLYSRDLYDVERRYIQKEHDSEYYKGLTNESKAEFDNDLGSFMEVMRIFAYRQRLPHSKEVEERWLEEVYEGMEENP